MTVLTRHLMGGDCPEVNISDLMYTYYRVLGKNSRGKNSREKKAEGKKGRWKKQPMEKTAEGKNS